MPVHLSNDVFVRQNLRRVWRYLVVDELVHTYLHHRNYEEWTFLLGLEQH